MSKTEWCSALVNRPQMASAMWGAQQPECLHLAPWGCAFTEGGKVAAFGSGPEETGEHQRRAALRSRERTLPLLRASWARL